MTASNGGAPVLVLASGSPRRRELLEGLGVALEVRPAHLDESALAGEGPSAHVERLAIEKVAAVARPGELVLAADTVVVVDGDMLGKPADGAEARRMLRRLAGREHVVLTAVAVRDPAGVTLSDVERTRVRFHPMRDAEIDWYVATGEPADKAGAYGIQGLGALFVAAITGNFTNVVGLPLPTVYRLLAAAGVDLVSRRT